MQQKLALYGTELSSRLLVGTAQYPSPAILVRRDQGIRHGSRHRLAAARGRRQPRRRKLLDV